MCDQNFSASNLLKKHRNLHCELCSKLFLSASNVKEHKSQCSVYCSVCNENVLRKYYSYHKRTNKHRSKQTTISLNEKITLRRSEFQERIESYTYINDNLEVLFPQEFFKESEVIIVKLLEDCRTKHITFKFNIQLECTYIKMSGLNSEESQQCTKINHITKMCLATLSDDLEELYSMQTKDICTKMSVFQERDSGWSLTHINFMEININQSSVLKGSTYIPLPSYFKKIPAFLNIINNDDYCFKWCIIASLFKDSRYSLKQLCNPKTYAISDISSNVIKIKDVELNFSDITFPLKLKDIKTFEQKNNISVNVFGVDDREIVGPYYLTKGEKTNHINLLLMTNEDKSHYILIRNLSK